MRGRELANVAERQWSVVSGQWSVGLIREGTRRGAKNGNGEREHLLGPRQGARNVLAF